MTSLTGDNGAVSTPHVVSVSRDDSHRFSKVPTASISLIAGFGVVGDAHAGEFVQHRSRVRRDPTQPNLRQVHLIDAELFGRARQFGYELGPGDLGENVLTAGVSLLELPTGTLLDFGGAAVRLTGLRNPCVQINRFRPGLLKVVLSRDGKPSTEPAPPTGSSDAATPEVVRRCGVMGVVQRGGEISAGQSFTVILPTAPHQPLVPV